MIFKCLTTHVHHIEALCRVMVQPALFKNLLLICCYDNKLTPAGIQQLQG